MKTLRAFFWTRQYSRSMPVQSLNCKLLLVFCLIASGSVAPIATAQVTPQQSLPAQPPTKLPLKGLEVNKTESLITTSGPTWQELTQAQRVSLTPLFSHWNSLDAAIKRKWVAIAANYPTLAPTEQVKLHSRMSEWSLLSKQERARARLNFAESKNLSSDQKVATWEAYQALDDIEKKKLAASAPPKPLGAAGAAKPVAPQKLATIPSSGKNQTQGAAVTSPQKVLDNTTVLPQPTQVIEPASKAD